MSYGLILLNIIVVLVGWFVINRQHNQRETRKEIKQHIDDIHDLLSNLLGEAIEHHQFPCDKKKEDLYKISFLIDHLETKILLLKVFNKSFDSYIIKLRKSCTLENFSPNLSNKDITLIDPIIQNIYINVYNLKHELNHSFSQKYWGI